MTEVGAPLRLEVHGARGSTAVSGHPFARHGGNTSCYALTLPGGHHVIVDCGTGLGRFEASLAALERPGAFEATILLTHFHWDHIQGLPTFGPLHAPTARLRIVAPPPQGFSIEEALDGAIRPPWFPVRFRDARAAITFEPLGDAPINLGPLEVRAASLRHPGGVAAYRLQYAGRALVIASDCEAGDGTHDAALRSLAEGADVLIHDAQYTPAEYEGGRQGWGHSTWEHATRAAIDAGVARLLLSSHDPRRTDEQVDEIVAAARTIFPATDAVFEGQRIEL